MAWKQDIGYSPILNNTRLAYIHIIIIDCHRRTQCNQLLWDLIGILQIISPCSWIHSLIRNNLFKRYSTHPTAIINSRFGPVRTFNIPRICQTTCFGYCLNTSDMIRITCTFSVSLGWHATVSNCWNTTYHWYALMELISGTRDRRSSFKVCITLNHSVVSRMIEWSRNRSDSWRERQ